MIVLSYILKDYYGEEKHEEVNLGDFNSATELAFELGKKGVKISRQAVNEAIRNDYIINKEYKVWKV